MRIKSSKGWIIKSHTKTRCLNTIKFSSCRRRLIYSSLGTVGFLVFMSSSAIPAVFFAPASSRHLRSGT
ncbi:MAG: hypothetical protein ACTHLL_06875 [Candidatus Nitrosocosmicus sp.]